nr:hypothetical protein GCM10020063_105380 [Dactylosporangium thailandense]
MAGATAALSQTGSVSVAVSATVTAAGTENSRTSGSISTLYFCIGNLPFRVTARTGRPHPNYTEVPASRRADAPRVPFRVTARTGRPHPNYTEVPASRRADAPRVPRQR